MVWNRNNRNLRVSKGFFWPEEPAVVPTAVLSQPACLAEVSVQPKKRAGRANVLFAASKAVFVSLKKGVFSKRKKAIQSRDFSLFGRLDQLALQEMANFILFAE